MYSDQDFDVNEYISYRNMYRSRIPAICDYGYIYVISPIQESKMPNEFITLNPTKDLQDWIDNGWTILEGWRVAREYNGLVYSFSFSKVRGGEMREPDYDS